MSGTGPLTCGCPKVLEIGPGTGQATAAMLERGWQVTAVELSPGLAGVLRQKLPTTEVIVADFDTWPLPPPSYDLVISATAFHWLDPQTRVQRCVDLLRPRTTYRRIRQTLRKQGFSGLCSPAGLSGMRTIRRPSISNFCPRIRVTGP
ncbi:class I SAM-dependent methyltransferase [Kribbella sp. NPDC004138]